MADQEKPEEVVSFLQKIANGENVIEEMSYGTLAFWIATIKRLEQIQDGVSLADFYAKIAGNPTKKVTIYLDGGT